MVHLGLTATSLLLLLLLLLNFQDHPGQHCLAAAPSFCCLPWLLLAGHQH
jgi:hypothetical protein